MPVSIIDVEVNDEKFKQFQELFEQYQEALKAMPGFWAEQEAERGPLGEGIGHMTAALLAQQDLIRKQGQEFRKQQQEVKRFQKMVEASQKPFRDLEKNSRALWHNIANATRSMLSWSAVGTLLGGALGLWGLDRLAERVSDTRRSSQALGITSGEQTAYGLTLGRYVDAQQNLQSIADAQADISKRWAFAAMGVNPNGKDPAQLGAEMALRAKKIWDRGNGTLQYAQAHGLTEFYSLADLRRLHAISGEELGRAVTAYGLDRRRLAVDDDTQRRWQDFLQTLGEARNQIFNTFVRHLIPLERPLEALMKVVADTLDAFVSNPHMAQWINDLGKEVKGFADYLGSPQLKVDLERFETDLGGVVNGLEKLLRVLGLIPGKGPQLQPGTVQAPRTPAGAMDPAYDVQKGREREWGLGTFNPMEWFRGGPLPGQLKYPLGYGIRSKDLRQRERAAVDYFQSQGWSRAQAVGLVARLEQESGLHPNPLGWNDAGTAYGMAQWHRDRQEEFRRWAGHDIRKSTPEEQLAFIQYELTHGLEKAAGDALRRARTPQEAADVATRAYERPAHPGAASRSTQALAAKLDVRINNNTGGNANVQATQAAAQ